MKTVVVNTSELSGPALDWAVAVAYGLELDDKNTPVWFDVDGLEAPVVPFNPSTNWAQGGPIIEQQEIELHKWDIDGWKAKDTNYQYLNTPNERAVFAEGCGPTPLIAAMRCFVASKLGNAVSIPAELLE